MLHETLKTVLTASLLGAQHHRNNMEKKPANSLIRFLEKTLNRMLPSLCVQVVDKATQSIRRGGLA